MAGTGLLALLDDITTLLDDVATLSKVAAQKTAGVVGDDLAVGAEQVNGLDPKRELPIVGKVAMGSLLNKVWIVPSALALSAFAPWAITPILMAGGAYLCYEGVEKIAHARAPKDDAEHKALTAAAMKSEADLMQFEKKKIKEAVRTDAILSAEIIVIALGTMAAEPLLKQAMSLSTVGLFMTGIVYGAVAAIVKMDDVGLHMQKTENGLRVKCQRGVGHVLKVCASACKRVGAKNAADSLHQTADTLIGKKGAGLTTKPARYIGGKLVTAMPVLMKTLSIVGTAAMFLVGGSILLHGIPGGEVLLHHAATALTSSGVLQSVVGMAGEALVGVAAGIGTLVGVKVAAKPIAALGAKISAAMPSIFKKKQPKVNVTTPEPAPALAMKETASSLGAKSISADHNAVAAFPSAPAVIEAPEISAAEVDAFVDKMRKVKMGQ